MNADKLQELRAAMAAAPAGRVSIGLQHDVSLAEDLLGVEAVGYVPERSAPVRFTIELDGLDSLRLFEAMSAVYEAAPELLAAVDPANSC